MAMTELPIIKSLMLILDLINQKPNGLEIVLTGGPKAHDQVIEAADLVTQMVEVKHYYRQGVPAREGIEK